MNDTEEEQVCEIEALKVPREGMRLCDFFEHLLKSFFEKYCKERFSVN
jgi:hypothetical protein